MVIVFPLARVSLAVSPALTRTAGVMTNVSQEVTAVVTFMTSVLWSQPRL